MNSIEKINAVCDAARELTEDEINEVSDMAEKQANYTSPLKLKKQGQMNTIGENNIKIINAIREIRAAMGKLEEEIQ